MKKLSLPPLTEHRPLRLLTVAAMYFAQGIQSGLLFTAIPAYMAMQGIDAAVIGGFIGTLILPWSLKLISAPLMDRFSFLPMGRRRPWVIAGMILALIGYIGMGLVSDPMNNIPVLISAGLVVSISTAFMDVAIDGMTVDIVSEEEYATANAYMTGGNIIGFAATTAIASLLLRNHGLPLTMMVTAIVIGLLALFPILLRERSGERIFPWSAGKASEQSLKIQVNSWVAIGKNIVKVIFLPASLLLATVTFLYGMTYGLFQTYMPVLTVQKLEWADTEFSGLTGIAGLTAGILVILIAKPLINKLGIRKGSVLFLAALAILFILMGFVPMLWENVWTIRVFIFSYYIIRTLLLITIFTFCMMICWKTVAATQFSLYMSVSNLGISSGAFIYATLKTELSYAQLFFVFALLFVVTAFILNKLNITAYKTRIKKWD